MRRGDVQCVVHGPVPAPRQPMDGLGRVARGSFDGRGAVVGGEALRGREPAHVAGVPDERGRDDVTDPEDFGQGGAGRCDCSTDPRLGGFALGVETDDVIHQFKGKAMPFPTNRVSWFDVLEEPRGLCNNEFFADPAGHELADERVKSTGRLVASPGDLAVPARQHAQHRRVVLDPDRDQRRRPQRRDRDGPCIVRIILLRSTAPQQPDPRRQRRRNVHDVFTRREELLRQEIAEPTRGLNRPPGSSARARAAPTTRLHGRRPPPRCGSAYVDRYRSSPSRPPNLKMNGGRGGHS